MTDHIAPVITICNNKGGVGKTTTAINLAAALADMGKVVLVIDADPQCNATFHLASEAMQGPRTTLTRILCDRSARLVDGLVDTSVDNVLMITADRDLKSQFESYAATDESYMQALPQKLAELQDKSPIPFDFIIIDTPPDTGRLTRSCLMASSHFLIPIDLGAYAITGLVNIRKLIEDVRQSNPQLKSLGVVPNMFRANTVLGRELTSQLLAMKNPDFNPIGLEIPYRQEVHNLSFNMEVAIKYKTDLADTFRKLAIIIMRSI